mmetsp:Transcript_12419/g.18206  ORF Transcript_12419/g.18206 Transcript_12419/m.18206 type:complete len:464 (+) Transcript_12419:98-1489(+)|eukprot:CAMPEP_0194229838 /NCGR_PEP_ID=MMETSP0156-20130528/44096_1 /TAXON_ID=33649 /ORGANISM="Thalassionema nitzschioides, Strain L26-B" /LENGTH=463 /DNA_ID=CAMNT_0038962401 /DNA_START=30 /DNA_END=1421 /DNA_ORIENTATION=+
MFRATVVLRSRALALSVHFKNPEFGMTDYEILTRGSAFLLSVDPPAEVEEKGEKYGYLADIRAERERKLRKQENYAYDPAGGPRRPVQELSWLEYVPPTFRPLVHVVASSHVLAPWLWPEYYPQPWLKSVNQEHCIYSLEVYSTKTNPETTTTNDETKVDNFVAKFSLNPYAIHYPEKELDLAIIHLKNEEGALRLMQEQGVEVMHLRDDLNHKKPFEEGDTVYFEGFEVTEDATKNLLDASTAEDMRETQPENDTRVFVPHNDSGVLLAATTARFLAKTALRPLPEGVCGGPTIDEDGRICGIVEGIVPIPHENEKLAGAASFVPSFRIHQFLDQYAERLMVEHIVSPEIFEKIVQLKETGEIGGGLNQEEMSMENEKLMAELKTKYTAEEFHALQKTVKREREEILRILEKEGGDLRDITMRVREETLRRRNEFMEKFQEEMDKAAEEVTTKSGDENPSSQ